MLLVVGVWFFCYPPGMRDNPVAAAAAAASDEGGEEEVCVRAGVCVSAGVCVRICVCLACACACACVHANVGRLVLAFTHICGYGDGGWVDGWTIDPALSLHLDFVAAPNPNPILASYTHNHTPARGRASLILWESRPGGKGRYWRLAIRMLTTGTLAHCSEKRTS